MADENPAQPAPKRAENRPEEKRGRLTVAALRESVKPPGWQHAAAAVIHGWDEHESATGAALRLTADDYAKALEAAARPGPDGNYEPHPFARGKPAHERHVARIEAAKPRRNS